MAATLFATFSAAIAAVAAGTWVDRSSAGRFIGVRRISGTAFVGCVCSAIVAAVVPGFVMMAVPHIGPINPLLAQAFIGKGPLLLLGWMATILLVAPVGEEMVFRGAIQGYLSSRIGTGVAIVMSALLFLLLHLPQLDGYWPAMLAILGLGLTAGIARARTGSLLGSITVHIAYNSVVMAFVLTGHS